MDEYRSAREEVVMVRTSGRNVVSYESQGERRRANHPRCIFARLPNRRMKAKPQHNTMNLRICRASGAVSVLGKERSQMGGEKK